MPFLTPRYDPGLVLASILIACFASYVTLDLAKRVRSTDSAMARVWWLGGSVAMGSGIWAMHFIGMQAYILPINLGYSGLLTLLSWVAAVAVSALALRLASRGSLQAPRLCGGALLMGAGICAMHYIGMAALDMRPGIVWNPLLVAGSAAIAVGASAVALLIFFWLRGVKPRHERRYQLLAALVMGLAISGMHYTGMAAAGFPEGSVCLSTDQLGGSRLGELIMLAALALLALTLLTSTLDARLQGRTAALAASLQHANNRLQSANAELQKRAFLDPLTGLPNRLLLEDRLGHALALLERGGRQSKRLALLFIDLDGFKPVNDSFGHAAGDQLLQEVAQRLLAVARDSDTVARLGGDEFVLLLEDVADVADSTALAQRLLQSLTQAFMIGDRSMHVAASVGIAVYPEHGPGDKLMSHADAAMYAAKRNGGSNYAVYESRMDSGTTEPSSLQHELRQALAEGQISLHYQPKFDARRGQLRGVEALARWRHPERGAIPPDVFIPLAERFGLINALGDWVINEACRQIQQWQQDGLRIRVAINLSVHQLRGGTVVARIEQALQRHRVAPELLLCEITESVAMEDIAATQQAFDGLARIGVFLSIDDFGTGYASLGYLKQLPARQLKIDRSFVQDLERSADARAVVDAVVKLAHALDLRVVAEGVETAGQRDVLLALNCDELQGYFFARPMSAQALQHWASGQRPEGALNFAPSAFIDLPPDEG